MICGGGTAGHVYPGLALAEALKLLDNQVDVFWVGTTTGLEAKLVSDVGYHFLPIKVSGLERRFSWRAAKAVFQLLKALFTSRNLLKKYRPDVVVGVGGYVGLPTLLAAYRSYPTVILEQNAVPGLANRILAARVSAVALTYEESRDYFLNAKKVKVTGNPVRSIVRNVSRDKAAMKLGVSADRLTVLIFGGSRGARKLNQAAVDIYPFCRNLSGLQIILITGNIEYEATAQLLSKHKGARDKVEYHLYSYLEEIWLAYAASDLAVVRAGATTLAEITARGLPAILIPYPFATDNHQFKNAQILERSGAAKIILDKDLNAAVLWRSISDLIFHPDELSKVAACSAAAGRPNAAAEAAELVNECNKTELRAEDLELNQ